MDLTHPCLMSNDEAAVCRVIAVCPGPGYRLKTLQSRQQMGHVVSRQFSWDSDAIYSPSPWNYISHEPTRWSNRLSEGGATSVETNLRKKRKQGSVAKHPDLNRQFHEKDSTNRHICYCSGFCSHVNKSQIKSLTIRHKAGPSAGYLID